VIGKTHRYPSDKRLGVPYSQFGRGEKDKTSHPLPGIEHRSFSP